MVNIRVVKLGGRAQSDPALASTLTRLWRGQPGALCIVHGGGDEISAMQRQLGGDASFAGGRRVTTEADLEVVRMVLSGTVNKRLVAALLTEGAKAVGLSGEDGGLLQAEIASRGTLGRVGVPSRVDPDLLWDLLGHGWLPVISPVAREMGGSSALNVNGDDAAAAIAAALGAAELLLLADVPGVIAHGSPVAALDPDSAMALVRDGTAGGGMAAKLEAACAALARGIPRVRIGDLQALTNTELGTVLLPAPLSAGVR